MAKPQLIYRQRLSGFWGTFAMGVVLGLAGGWIRLSRGEGIDAALLLGLPVTAGLTVLAYGMAWLTRDKTVARLASDGVMLTGWRASPLGRGRSFAIPIVEITGWRWFAKRLTRTSIAAVLEFTHNGEVFRLPPLRAQPLDVAELRKLAPLVVSDAVAHSSADLIGRGGIGRF